MIVKALNNMPRNANQIAVGLKLDYKTVRHHLKILMKNGIISSAGDGYATEYSISPELSESIRLFKDNCRRTSSPTRNHRVRH